MWYVPVFLNVKEEIMHVYIHRKYLKGIGNLHLLLDIYTTSPLIRKIMSAVKHFLCTCTNLSCKEKNTVYIVPLISPHETVHWILEY